MVWIRKQKIWGVINNSCSNFNDCIANSPWVFRHGMIYIPQGTYYFPLDRLCLLNSSLVWLRLFIYSVIAWMQSSTKYRRPANWYQLDLDNRSIILMPCFCQFTSVSCVGTGSKTNLQHSDMSFFISSIAISRLCNISGQTNMPYTTHNIAYIILNRISK